MPLRVNRHAPLRPGVFFLCLLAYYVEWHLRQAWTPPFFEDEALERDRQMRDAVAPATPSARARRKNGARQTADGLPLHRFDTLVAWPEQL